MLLMVTTRQTAPVCVKLQLQDSYHLPGELEKLTEGKIFEEQKQPSSCWPTVVPLH